MIFQTNSEVVVERSVMSQLTVLPYSQASEDSTVIATLAAGEGVQYLGDEGSYSKITTTAVIQVMY